jgi:hypothetical protein
VSVIEGLSGFGRGIFLHGESGFLGHSEKRILPQNAQRPQRQCKDKSGVNFIIIVNAT